MLDADHGAGSQDTDGEGSVGSMEQDLLTATVSLQKVWTKEDNELPKDVARAALFLESRDGAPQVALASSLKDEDACTAARDASMPE